MSADDVAAHFRVHRSVARARLERLVEAELLSADFERRTGRSGPGAGRPAKVYSVTPEVTALEFPRRRYELLVQRLLAAFGDGEGNKALFEVGLGFGADLASAAGPASARSIRSGVERACAALGALGFQASVAEVTGDRAVVVTPTCPLRPLVVATPAAAAVDRGMWVGLTRAYLPRRCASAVRCETGGCGDVSAVCRVQLEFGEGSAVGSDPALL